MPRERTARSRADESAGPEPSGGRWLTIHEACAFLGVDQSTLRRWSDTGKVPVFRTPGGHRRYAEADLRTLVGGGPRLQERPRVSRQTLTDRSLRSEEHTSELQSPDHLVCRLLLEKKNKTNRSHTHPKDQTQQNTNTQ